MPTFIVLLWEIYIFFTKLLLFINGIVLIAAYILKHTHTRTVLAKKISCESENCVRKSFSMFSEKILVVR